MLKVAVGKPAVRRLTRVQGYLNIRDSYFLHVFFYCNENMKIGRYFYLIKVVVSGTL